MNKAMYLIIRKNYIFSKEELFKTSFNLVFDYLYETFIETNPNINSNFDKIKQFYENKNVVFKYMSQVKMEQSEKDGYILIRDKGLTQLAPNTLTCAIKDIEDNALTIYINKDIKLGKGKSLGQIGHCICSYLYHYYIKYIPNIDLTDFIEYMDAQKKIALKCSIEEMEEHLNEAITILKSEEDIVAFNMGIFDRDKDEVPDWIKNLKLYSK